MSFHSFTPESYWDYHRSYIRALRLKKEAEAEGKHGWDAYPFDPISHNHPHYNGMYGMAQTYFSWLNGEYDELEAVDGYYFLNGSSRWGGFGAGRPNMPCWQFHCDDYREYSNWEWWPLREGWKDSRARIHYRKRFEGKGIKPDGEEQEAAIKLFV